MLFTISLSTYPIENLEEVYPLPEQRQLGQMAIEC
jgi:hypothetical protein